MTSNIAKKRTTRNFGDRSKLRLQDQSTPTVGRCSSMEVRNVTPFRVRHRICPDSGAFNGRPSWAADFGTAEEAKAMLEKAVAAVKEDKAKALDLFNKGEGGFKDHDLYVFCANASDGILTAHPFLKGEHLQEIKGKKGAPLGQEIMQNAAEGTIKETTYWWPRPGSDEPLEKHTFFTRVGDQDCGVGYYKQ